MFTVVFKVYREDFWNGEEIGIGNYYPETDLEPQTSHQHMDESPKGLGAVCHLSAQKEVRMEISEKQMTQFSFLKMLCSSGLISPI